MAKTLRTAALVVGAVALIAATAGAAAGALAPAMAGTASIAGVSTATLSAIGTYAGLAAGALSFGAAAFAPGFTAQGNASTFQTNPQSGLPYAIGRTRMSGLRIFANTNSRPGYTKFHDLLWFGAMLTVGGQIEGIESFSADGVAVSFAADGNAVGQYHDYMAQRLHTGGPQASAIALTLGGGAAPGWTSAHRLSGITHAMWCLRFNKEGEMYGSGAPEPSWVGKWVKVYDPRLDSTYPGGSGPCRALNEATYVWSQNPGLHALTWALGRWQNGKRTCGIGAPIANIRVAEFVECANVCDANGWKVGGVEWTTDTKYNTLKRILQAGGARPTKSRGMIGCLVSAPRTAIATIESRHLIDRLQLVVTKSRRDRYNTVIPRYIDEESDWSVISGKAISVPEFVTADRGQRTKEIDYPLVQVFTGEDAKQPGHLAAYDICNSREGGPFTWSTGPEWIGIKTGDVINLNVPEEGLVNQPILITKATPDPANGKISFAGETETHSKHAFALGQSTTPPAPFKLQAPDLKPPAPDATSWSASGSVTGEGLPAIVVIGTSQMPSADAVVIQYREAGSDVWLSGPVVSAKGIVKTVIAPLASKTVYEIRVGYRVGSIDGDFLLIGTVTTGEGKLSGIENGATKGAPAGTYVGLIEASQVYQELTRSNDNAIQALFNTNTFKAYVDEKFFIQGQPLSTIVQQEVVNRIDGQQAIAGTLNLLGAKSPDGSAFLLNGANVVTGTDEQGNYRTLSSDLTTLGTTTAGHQSQIDFLLSSLVTSDGALSKAVLRVDQDGAIAGFSLSSDGTIGAAKFLVNTFQIVNPGGGQPFTVFAIGNDGVVEIPSARVKNLAYEALIPLLGGQYNNLDDDGDGRWFQVLPGGFIVQGGALRASISSDQSLSVIFKKPFPNKCLGVMPLTYLSSPNKYADIFMQILGDPSLNGASFYAQATDGDATPIQGFNWIALGK